MTDETDYIIVGADHVPTEVVEGPWIMAGQTVADYIIVGSGLTGATIARLLTDAGCSVVVLDRRGVAGGNVVDATHQPSGVRYGVYGPHYFRTSSERIWKFVNRFTGFHPYEAVVKSWVDGELENWPIAASYIRKHIGESWRPDFTGDPTNLEEAALGLMPRPVYEKFVRDYNEKQWGRSPVDLSPGLCKRFDVREDDDPRLTPKAKWQGVPTYGYAAMMGAMLVGIDVRLGVDYLAARCMYRARKKLIFTGPIDEYFGFDLGRLDYRGQKREHSWFQMAMNLQPVGQVNLPQHDSGDAIRMIEWKHMMPPGQAAATNGTLVTTETPHSPTNSNDYEYPFPDDRNARLYAHYRQRADGLDGVIITGRLGLNKYIDMDAAIGIGFKVADTLMEIG